MTQAPLSSLYPFPLYTRESYRAAFGKEPPPYDPTKPVKEWFDPSGIGTYYYYDSSFNYVAFALSQADAETVNLYGPTLYPAYTPTATPALFEGLQSGSGFANQVAIPPTQLSTQVQANAFAALLGLPSSAVSNQNTQQQFTANGETRGLWYVTVNGVAYNVGQMFVEQTLMGLGSPGGWSLINGVPTWTSTVNNNIVAPANAAGPIPMRALVNGESLQVTSLIDPTPVVVTNASNDLGTSGLSQYQSAQISNIETMLYQWCAKNGMSVALTPKQ